MLISGLILTIDGGAETFVRLENLLCARPEITVAELDGIYLPVATEAEGPRHAEEIQNWLGSLPGVRQVAVVSVQFDEEEPSEPLPFRSRRREEAEGEIRNPNSEIRNPSAEFRVLNSDFRFRNGPPPHVGGYGSRTTPKEILP